jgi:hypothetical protein
MTHYWKCALTLPTLFERRFIAAENSPDQQVDKGLADLELYFFFN